MVDRVVGALVLSLALPPAASFAQHHTTHKPAQPVRMTATAYCDGGKTDGGPVARRGIVAADPRVLPLGSQIRVEVASRRQYSGAYEVMDTGSKVKGHRVDIFMPNCPEAKKFGERAVTVRVLQRGTQKDAHGPGTPR